MIIMQPVEYCVIKLVPTRILVIFDGYQKNINIMYLVYVFYKPC